MKKIIASILAAVLLVSASAMVMAAEGDTTAASESVFVASAEQDELIDEFKFGVDPDGKGYIAIGLDKFGNTVYLYDEYTAHFNLTTIHWSDFPEDVKKEAESILPKLRKELAKAEEEVYNAESLRTVFPLLPKKPVYAVTRMQGSLSLENDEIAMEKIIEAGEEITKGLVSSFAYSKVNNDRLYLKFDTDNDGLFDDEKWEMIPKYNIKLLEDGNYTITFVPKSVNYLMAILKVVK